MSDHDVLMSRFVALQNYLESYCEENKPSLAEAAMRKLTEAGILISKFVEDDDD